MDSNRPSRVRVKMCGITRVEDALSAVESGADAIGLVFYPESPRVVDIDTARQVICALPPFVASVGLFVNADPDYISKIIERTGIELLQFHGEEPPELCCMFRLPYIKAVRMQPDRDIRDAIMQYKQARGILLDGFVEGLWGGSGKTFDWSMVPEGLKKPIILAGGLTPDNVSQAIKAVRPFAVDVSGGIESSKGIKDSGKMNAFMRGVYSAQIQ